MVTINVRTGNSNLGSTRSVFTKLDLPDGKLEGEFVYNYFTRDERVEVPFILSQRRLREAQSLEEIRDFDRSENSDPRYIRLNFSVKDFSEGSFFIGQGEAGTQFRYSDLKDSIFSGTESIIDETFANNESQLAHPNPGLMHFESDVCSIYDIPVDFTDTTVSERVKAKIDLIANLLDSGSDKLDTLNKVVDMVKQQKAPPVASRAVVDLYSPANNSRATFVNAKEVLYSFNKFKQGSLANVRLFYDKRYVKKINVSDFDYSVFFNAGLEDSFNSYNNQSPNTTYHRHSQLDSKEERLFDENRRMLPRLIRGGQLQTSGDFVTNHGPGFAHNTAGLSVKGIGFILEKTMEGNDGEATVKRFVVGGREDDFFIDTDVTYGRSYTYRVAPMYRIVYRNPPETSAAGHPKISSEQFFINGGFSAPTTIRCIEKVPPPPPPIVFFNFDYNTPNGLILQWRMPVSTQRDIKYFQIFRRKKISEPFTCIAMIDFDDSEIKTSLSENVHQKNIIKSRYALTHFKDENFGRASEFIYAVATVDAHGLSSGYSSQFSVNFNISSNSIEVRKISQSGAPKQYPNFFIDPELDPDVAVNSLTQDVMLSSGKKMVKIYFDPDAEIIMRRPKVPGEAPTYETIIRTSSRGVVNAGLNLIDVYKLHLINVDRQLSADLELNVIEE